MYIHTVIHIVYEMSEKCDIFFVISPTSTLCLHVAQNGICINQILMLTVLSLYSKVD